MAVKKRKKTGRQVPDFNRLRAAISGPGADTRLWVSIARVEEEENSVYWMEGTGWVADVTFQTGPNAGEGDTPCRVLGPIGGSGTAQTRPVEPNSVVAVALVDGDANVQPVILGMLHNPTDQPVPTEVNELEINQSVASSTNITVSDYKVESQYAGDVRISATGGWYIVAPEVNISPNGVRDDATQPYVRGDDFADALNSWVEIIGTVVAANASFCAAAAGVLGLPYPITPDQIAEVGTETASLIAARTEYLSSKIKGE